jgi:electron transfer flavoprotein beta subunit
MKITVCFKTLPDYGRLSEKDWVWDKRHFVQMNFVRQIFNCFEESALEMTLKLSESSESLWGSPEITALTVDDPASNLFLKHLMSVGYHHAIRIQCNSNIDLRFNPLAISHLISNYIKKEDQQLVILGLQGGDGDNRQTGALVAERLGWPCIREVTGVTIAPSPDCLKVTSRMDGASLIQTVKLPMVLIIGQSPDFPYLRIPTLKQKLASKKMATTVITDEELEMTNDTLINNDKTLVDLQRPPANPSCVFLEGKSAREQSQHLYDQYLKERLTP